MKIYREITSSSHFFFVVRPPVLFDVSRFEMPHFGPEAREFYINAWHILNQRFELFAIAKNRGLGPFAKAAVLDAPELPSSADDAAAAESVSPDLTPDLSDLERLALAS